MTPLLRRIKLDGWLDVYIAFMALVIPWQRVSVITKGISPFHVANIVIVGVLVGVALMRRERLIYPYVKPLTLYLCGSFLGMFASYFWFKNGYTIFQDLYLYTWMAIIVTFLYKQGKTGKLVLWWLVSAAIVFAATLAFNLGDEGTRTEFTFRNPNRAAAYWLFNFFLAFHPSVTKWMRIGIWSMALTGIAMTGSNSGVLGLAVGLVIFSLSWSYIQTHGRMNPLRIVGAMVLVIGAILVSQTVGQEEVLEAVGTTASGGDGSRIERSSGVRQELWRVGLETFADHPFGIGPGSFVLQVETGFVETGLELHSDFVATLVERGIIGMMGFLWLLGVVAMMGWRCLRLAARFNDRAVAAWTSALVALAPAYFSFSVTHEILHHETIWITLAFLAAHLLALERATRRSQAMQRAAQRSAQLAYAS